MRTEAQVDRLFAILDGAGRSAERAISAHAQARQHLDSAEYQLLRLFDEFPMLAAARKQQPAARPIAVAASSPPRALAA